MPIQVDIEDLKKPVAPLLVPISPDGVQEAGHDDVRADDRVRRPFCSQERHTLDQGVNYKGL